MNNCGLTEKQMESLFKDIAKPENKIEKLYMGLNKNMKFVSSDVLGEAVAKLEVFHCNDCELNMDLVFLNHINRDDLRLKELNFKGWQIIIKLLLNKTSLKEK